MPLRDYMILTLTAAAAIQDYFTGKVSNLLILAGWTGGVCLAAGGVVTGVFVWYSGKRLRELEKLNDYLALVCGGKYSLDVPDNSEGELSILKNNLYKVIVLLRSSIEALTDEKRFLSDSLADISHQLKTPLTSMMVLADLLEEDTDGSARAYALARHDASQALALRRGSRGARKRPGERRRRRA